MAALPAHAQALGGQTMDSECESSPVFRPHLERLNKALTQAKANIEKASAPEAWERSSAPSAGVWLDCAIADTARVLTPDGPRTIGSLQVGDLVTTKDDGALPLRWIGRHALSTQQLSEHPSLCPMLIRENALSEGFPRRPLYVSPRAHLLMRPKAADGSLSESCLVPAAALDQNTQICRALPRGNMRYCQLMFDVHAIMFVEGLEMDSFHPAALRPTPEERHIYAEVLGIFPDLEHGMETYGPLARPRVMH